MTNSDQITIHYCYGKLIMYQRVLVNIVYSDWERNILSRELLVRMFLVRIEYAVFKFKNKDYYLQRLPQTSTGKGVSFLNESKHHK